MKPVDQTRVGSEGDCYAACIASLLELPLADVPNFCADSSNWLEHADKWLREEHEYTLLGFRPRGEGAFYCIPAMYHIMAGKSPRGVDHAVVAFQGKMVHDPHPTRAGLMAVDEYEYLVPCEKMLLFDQGD